MIELPEDLRTRIDDWHTHSPSRSRAIINLPSVNAPAEAGFLYSVGIHPWEAAEATQELLEDLRARAAEPYIVAVGEGGLDRLRGPSLEVQLPVFEAQARIADELSKPLIIHSVRTIPEILAAHKRLRPSVPWIIHGFRGGQEAARQILARDGLYISLGSRFRTDAADVIPPSRLLRETDDDPSALLI